MPRISQVAQATTTTETTVEVKLETKLRQMLLERLRERADIGEWEKEKIGTKAKPGRKRRIDDEIQDIFKKAKQGKALIDGVSIDGWGLVLVVGKTKTFDQMGFMKKHGLTQ